jgi:hypothetical protein
MSGIGRRGRDNHTDRERQGSPTCAVRRSCREGLFRGTGRRKPRSSALHQIADIGVPTLLRSSRAPTRSTGYTLHKIGPKVSPKPAYLHTEVDHLCQPSSGSPAADNAFSRSSLSKNPGCPAIADPHSPACNGPLPGERPAVLQASSRSRRHDSRIDDQVRISSGRVAERRGPLE